MNPVTLLDSLISNLIIPKGKKGFLKTVLKLNDYKPDRKHRSEDVGEGEEF